MKEVGSLQATLGKWEEARTSLVEAIEHASVLYGKVADTVPQETLIQSYFHLGRVAKGLKNEPCLWFRKCVALAPATPEALESFQYRVAVKAALASAREELKACR